MTDGTMAYRMRRTCCRNARKLPINGGNYSRVFSGLKALGYGCHELHPGHANIHLQEFSSTIARNYRSSLEWLLDLGFG
ncbi:hypothetical protein [Mesorhizobium sp. M0701]|uniref:hypothetical protein n=1 Tax=Mesorhizobium sp. M0701 TaxID=2956989 RepID=UPI00333B21EC